MRPILLALPLALLGVSAPAVAQRDTACFDVPEPVVSLAYGSRYTDESEDRSDLDEDASAAVDAALDPIDTLVSDMANAANDAAAERDVRAANCVIAALATWAEADALSELNTMNAHLTAPSRLGGFALAYLQAAPVATDLSDARAKTIETWLAERARSMIGWFENEAPPMASQNNLRAWAGLAAAASGLAAEDVPLQERAAETFRRVVCAADEDGALPMEMKRGPRALHYHMHAVAPLVVTAALLEPGGYELFSACDGALHRAVEFIPRAFDDPRIVEDKAGEAQLFFTGEDELKSYELAWAAPYLAHFSAPMLEEFVAPFRPLGHSKLGGSQNILW